VENAQVFDIFAIVGHYTERIMTTSTSSFIILWGDPEKTQAEKVSAVGKARGDKMPSGVHPSKVARARRLAAEATQLESVECFTIAGAIRQHAQKIICS